MKHSKERRDDYMNFVKDLLMVAERILTVLPLLLLVTLCMGKRSVGELPVFDYLVIITLATVVGADIADPSVPHIHIASAVILIGCLQIIVARITIKYRKIGKLITFEPTIVIHDGKLIANNIKRLKYSIDNVLQMLREKDVFDISEVHLAIVEANGALSVLKKESKLALTIEDMNLTKKAASISYAVIIDGAICTEVLEKLKLDEQWLRQKLSNENISDMKEVYFAAVNEKKELQISLKNFMDSNKVTFPIYH